MIIIFLFLCFLIPGVLLADGLSVPSAVKESASTKGMVWNKWETESFIILSINFGFGSELNSSLEQRKHSVCDSWGIGNSRLPVKCKLVCVPDAASLKRLFSLDSPKLEVKNDSSGSVSEMSIWIDEERFGLLGGFISELCLEGKPYFLRKGVPAITDYSPAKISETVLSVPSVSLDKLLSAEAQGLESQSVVACLFLRKEFGSKIFSLVVSGTELESACGFPDRVSMQSSLTRYLNNLKSDLESGRTPATYLKP